MQRSLYNMLNTTRGLGHQGRRQSAYGRDAFEAQLLQYPFLDMSSYNLKGAAM